MIEYEIMAEYGLKNDKDAQKWTRSFAKYIFNEITERLKKVNPNIDYKMPRILFADTLTSTDHKRLHEINETLHEKRQEFIDWLKVNNKADKDSIKEAMRTIIAPYFHETEDEYKVLNKKMEERTVGKFDEGKTIYLNKKYFNETVIDFESLTHELIHSIHHQSVGQILHKGYSKIDQMILNEIDGTGNEQKKTTDTHFIEFFSELNGVILEDILSDSTEYEELSTRLEKPKEYTLKELNEAKAYFEKDYAKTFVEFAKKIPKSYEQTIKKIEKIGLEKALTELSNKTKDLTEEYYELSNELIKYAKYKDILGKDNPIGDFHFKNILKNCQRMLSLTTKYGSIQTDDARGALIKLNSLKERLQEKSEDIRDAFKSYNCNKKHNSLSIFSKSGPYSIANFAISLYKDELKTNWAQVLFMEPEEVNERYFKNLIEEITYLNDEERMDMIFQKFGSFLEKNILDNGIINCEEIPGDVLVKDPNFLIAVQNSIKELDGWYYENTKLHEYESLKKIKEEICSYFQEEFLKIEDAEIGKIFHYGEK